MIELETLLLFIAATLAINLSPGPSVLYVSTVTAAQGLRAGLVSVAGMSVGILGHVIAAAAGVVTLLATSTTAFLVIKYIGAAYLIYLGLSTLMRSTEPDKQSRVKPSDNLQKYFYKGILVDLFNPKIGLFFLAFLPQFVNANNGSVFAQSIMLGLVFICCGAIVNSCIAFVVASSLGSARSKSKELIERWIPGFVLIGLGARLSFED